MSEKNFENTGSSNNRRHTNKTAVDRGEYKRAIPKYFMACSLIFFLFLIWYVKFLCIKKPKIAATILMHALAKIGLIPR